MKYLGIDYGTKKVGLALSDDEGRLAFPYDIIKNTPDLANQIADLVEETGVGEIVIGHSLDQAGNENAVMDNVHDLIGQLSFTAGLPVHLQAETFTSVEARRGPGFSGDTRRNPARKRSSKSAKPIDDSAAALILQRYLDTH